MKLVVLGAGMQGRVIAGNLAARDEVSEVVIADVVAPQGALPEKVTAADANALDPQDVARVTAGAAAAVTALPGPIGRAALAHLVRAHVPTVDVSFTPESPFDLDGDARREGVSVVVDCGVAPGLSHILVADARRELDSLDSLRIYVGGMPIEPPAVFRHAVYFNARDLLDEYIRPARLVRGDRAEAPSPLDAPVDVLQDDEVGPLEAFPSDGLRSLLASYPDVPDMVELTLRVPGHLTLMHELRAIGLLDGGEATDALAGALARRFPSESYPDRLLMEVWARRGEREVRYRLHATHDGKHSAMGRTTGYTTAAAAMALARRSFHAPGVHPPERLGEDPAVTLGILDDLAERGLRIEREGRLHARVER